jgi:hypothetical protein
MPTERNTVIIVLGVAAGAALAVLIYERVRQKDPELASASMRRVHQLAAVIVIITSGIEKTFDALQGSRPKPQPLYAAYGDSSYDDYYEEGR